jgi:hypothetical protein
MDLVVFGTLTLAKASRKAWLARGRRVLHEPAGPPLTGDAFRLELADGKSKLKKLRGADATWVKADPDVYESVKAIYLNAAKT